MIITIFSHLFIRRRSDFCPKIYCQEISLALYRGGLIHFWETTVWFPKCELSKKAPTPRSWDLSSRHLETIWWWDPLKKSGWHFFSIDTPYEETCSVWVDYLNLSQFLSLADLFVSKIIIGCTVWVHFSFKHKGLLLYINFVCYPRRKWKLLSALSIVRDSWFQARVMSVWT